MFFNGSSTSIKDIGKVISILLVDVFNGRVVAALKYFRGQGLKRCRPPWSANEENFEF